MILSRNFKALVNNADKDKVNFSLHFTGHWSHSDHGNINSQCPGLLSKIDVKEVPALYIAYGIPDSDFISAIHNQCDPRYVTSTFPGLSFFI